MNEIDLWLAEPLRIGGPDIVLAQHVEHRGARQAGDVGRLDDAEAQRRQHQLLQVFGERGAAHAVDDREPAEPHREDDEKDHAEIEGRKGEAEQGQHAAEKIDPRVAAHRGHDAERMPIRAPTRSAVRLRAIVEGRTDRMSTATGLPVMREFPDRRGRRRR